MFNLLPISKETSIYYIQISSKYYLFDNAQINGVITSPNISTALLNQFIKIQDYMFLSFFYSNFYPIFIFLTIAILLSLIILSLSYLLVNQNPETEKLSTYECGFEPYEDARHKFEVKFYLVAILFIIFDIEAMYLFPWSISLTNINSVGFCAMIDFIIELGLGFAYIWFVKALNWN